MKIKPNKPQTKVKINKPNSKIIKSKSDFTAGTIDDAWETADLWETSDVWGSETLLNIDKPSLRIKRNK